MAVTVDAYVWRLFDLVRSLLIQGKMGREARGSGRTVAPVGGQFGEVDEEREGERVLHDLNTVVG